ncbi:MAG: hypothetical protein L3J98_15735 [Gammaproteobacteria bacterium]|nr:hypothetical protein [Gammaproteobacteria bacterium]MCF6261586.1 hypothetical protein [Gammaproteobacteria bacterium]
MSDQTSASEMTVALITIVKALTEQPNFDRTLFTSTIKAEIDRIEKDSTSSLDLITLKTILRSVSLDKTG